MPDIISDGPKDAWLERSRLDGMILDGFTYGIFFLLSIQACIAIQRGAGSARVKLSKLNARILLVYVLVTFVLGTIGFAANARYTEDIWINFRGEGRTPDDLIINEFDFWVNRLAIDSQEVMVWIMNALLLYRCFVIWNYRFWVVGLMSSIYLSIVALSVSVMVFAHQHAIFSKLNLQLSFLAMGCAFNFLFTILVATRLLSARKRIRDALGPEHAATYTSITATLVESTALYFVFDVAFVFAFAFHSNVQNLILLENCLIQAISQLLIIVRVAQGREYDSTIATVTHGDAKSGPLAFQVRQETTTRKGDVVVELSSVAQPGKSQDTGQTASVSFLSETKDESKSNV